MKLMGIGDEAGASFETQLAVTRDLGWKFIEMRAAELPGHAKANFHDITDAAFDAAVQQLEQSGVQVYCFGSAVMNWAKKVGDPFDITLGEVRRCIPRMNRLGAKFVRIMSFKPGDDEFSTPPEVFRRVKDVTNMFLDAGIQRLCGDCAAEGRHGMTAFRVVPGPAAQVHRIGEDHDRRRVRLRRARPGLHQSARDVVDDPAVIVGTHLRTIRCEDICVDVGIDCTLG